MDFNMWTVVTVAVIMGCTIPILGILASVQEKKLKFQGGAKEFKAELETTRAELNRANARIDEMGERIKVLERIATDPDVELAKSLNKLERNETHAAG